MVVAIICVQLFGTKVYAANIDEVTARQLGTYYLSVMSNGKVADESQISLVYEFMNPDLNIPAAYVFNVEDQGFVIVSGSDLWYPILGYSTEGLLNVDKMAPAFKEYFDGLCEYIIYSQNTGEPLIEDIDKEWDELRYQKLPEMKNAKATNWLLDNKWGQGEANNPTYNKLCPHKTVGGVEQYSYVGCVATAMSQIMHYWKYPVEPVKDYIGYNCYLDGSYYDYVDIDMSEVTYDYDHMPIQLTSSSTEEEINATALLCYHAGVSVKMSYGLEGSGALSEDVPTAFRDVFLYDSLAEMKVRANLNNNGTQTTLIGNDEWVDILTTEIEAGRPMYYAGYSVSGTGRDAGGHAFVCDGKHPTNGKFHFNWGWDGMPNVWSDVRNNSLAASSYDFKYHQRAIIKLQPRGYSEGIKDVDVTLKPAYPNPTNTQVTIGYSVKNQDVNELKVYSIDGRLMDTVKLNGESGSVTLNVSNYPNGLYIYRLGASANKFIVK